MNIEIAHVFSDLWILPDQLYHTAKIESRFFPKHKINAFYNIPRSNEVRKKLNEVVTLREVDFLTKPFSTLGEAKQGGFLYYGEKIHLTEIQSPNVLYLDCDILVVHDPIQIFDLDFDIAAPILSRHMREEVKKTYWINRWEELFKRYNLKISPFIGTQAGFYKNNIHEEIRNKWLYFMNEELPLIHNMFNKEEISLSMACSGLNILYLGEEIFGDLRFRTKPFFTDIKDWESEDTPLMWELMHNIVNVN